MESKEIALCFLRGQAPKTCPHTLVTPPDAMITRHVVGLVKSTKSETRGLSGGPPPTLARVEALDPCELSSRTVSIAAIFNSSPGEGGT